MAPREQKRRGQVGKRAQAEIGGTQQDSRAQAKDPPTEALSNEVSPSEPPFTFTTPSAIQREDDSNFPSPNTSPAHPPTETPAPTPVRPPVQRLDSLGISGRGAYGTRGGVGGRMMAGKFKPKAVTRRSQAEREAAQRDAEEQRRELYMEAQQEQDMNFPGRMQGVSHSGSRNWERGRMKGRGRGRGEVMGRGRMDRNNRPQREATGLFGIAPAASAKRPAIAPQQTSTPRARIASDSMEIDAQSTERPFNAGVSRLSTKSTKLNTSPKSSRVKEDPESLVTSTTGETSGFDNGTQSTQIKVEVPDPIYPEEQEEGSRPAPRVDIERISLVTDDEDADSDVEYDSRNKGKAPSIPRKSGLKPVRLQREEHRERITLVNTEPAASTLTDDAKEPTDYQPYVSSDDEGDDEIEFARNNKNWAGVWRDDEMEVKHDPGASDAMDLDVIADPTNLSKSPQDSTVQINNGKDSTGSITVDKDKAKRRQKPKNKHPVLQTEEDKAEYARHLEDLRVLAEELGGVQINSMDENDGGMLDVDELTSGRRQTKDLEGRLYLFQFPPALPTLVNEIKKEEATVTGPDLMEVEAGPSNATEAIDLTKPDPEEAIPVETPHGTFYVTPEMVTEEGFVGKVIVRKSGKVQLDWGGVLLELGRGVQSDYLTTTMIVDDGGPSDASAKPVRTGTGMGKVMGSFVLKPDFEGMGLM